MVFCSLNFVAFFLDESNQLRVLLSDSQKKLNIEKEKNKIANEVKKNIFLKKIVYYL